MFLQNLVDPTQRQKIELMTDDDPPPFTTMRSCEMMVTYVKVSYKFNIYYSSLQKMHLVVVTKDDVVNVKSNQKVK